MNICFFNLKEEFGTAMTGGRGRATSLLAKELRRRGHNVEFYCEPPSYFRIPIVSKLLFLFLPSLLPSSHRSATKRFHEFLKEHKIDVAVGHGGTWPFWVPLNNLPCRLITFWHNIPTLGEQFYADIELRSHAAKRCVLRKLRHFRARKWSKFLYTRSFFYAVRYSDKFVLLSERFIPEFAPAKKFPQKVCAIPNIAPFDAQNVPTNEKKKELLWLGRMDFAHKRPDLMLQVWQKLQDRFPDWSLRFVGDGGYLSELKTLAKELGVQRVFFDGHQDPTPYYRSASIFCTTSAFEGLSMTLLETQAYCCVPVAFESFSSVRDIIDDGVNGFLVPPFDLDAYAEKLSELMSDPALRERLARNGQKSISKFSAEAIGDKWKELLGGGIERRKKKELLWLGRVEFTHKRPDFMLQIWQCLQDRFPDWSLRFVGDGGYLSELKTLAKELGVQRVFFDGHQDPTPYYRSAPIYCMTSTFEGFGLTLVESEAYGCVPVAFDSHGAFRDIIEDGVNGVLIPPFDLDAYAEKLSKLMQDNELRERLAVNAQKSIAKFSPEAIGDQWEKLFEELQLS